MFILSGRIEAEDVVELQRLFTLEAGDRHLALNLKDVTLVDPEAVKFLSLCEAQGVKFEDCPAYIREWINRENSGGPGRKSQHSN